MAAGNISLAVCLVITPIVLVGCSSTRSVSPSVAKPVIVFSSVPIAGADDAAVLNSIKGRVIGAQPGQRIVLYAKGKTTWWVQPFADRPFTRIETNSRWKSATHPGTEYAALLVGTEFHPPLTTSELPSEGVIAVAVTRGEPAFWQRWWFPLLCVVAGAFAIFGFHRLQLYQTTKKLNLRFEERLAERMRVAQELHDTLFQGVLSASMQLHVAVEQLPPDSPAQPALSHVLDLMGQVVEEGRNTVRGLRSSADSAHDLEQRFSRIRQELGIQQDTEFRIIVEGSALPLQSAIRGEVYNIGREALANAFRHSGASLIEIELEYAAQQLRVLIRDNGCGMDPAVVDSRRGAHGGLSGMQGRAERIGAKLRVMSSAAAGTEVELRVPSRIAFESYRSHRASKWASTVQVDSGEIRAQTEYRT